MQDKQCGCGHWGHWGLTVWKLLGFYFIYFFCLFSGGWEKEGKRQIETALCLVWTWWLLQFHQSWMVFLELKEEQWAARRSLEKQCFCFTPDWQEFSETPRCLLAQHCGCHESCVNMGCCVPNYTVPFFFNRHLHFLSCTIFCCCFGITGGKDITVNISLHVNWTHITAFHQSFPAMASHRSARLRTLMLANVS